MNPSSGDATPGFTFVLLPDIRVAVPIGSTFAVGLGLGVVAGFANVTPTKSIQQTPINSSKDVAQPITPEGKTIGFVTSSDKWVGTFVFPRASLFVRAAF